MTELPPARPTFQFFDRQTYDVGSYKHEPRLVDPYNVGANAMRPFTARDFK